MKLNNIRDIFLVIFTLAISVAFLVSCSKGPGLPPPDTVTLQLKWIHQAQFAGYYVASDKGYYADENIE